MCFSAASSFSAGGILLAIGVVSIKNAKTATLRLFAAIPLIFAVQQLAEGALWLILSNADLVRWCRIPAYIFLIFAQVVWPLWVPLSVTLIEKNKTRKKILYFLFSIGVALSLYLGYSLFISPMQIGIQGYHIHYDLDFPFANSRSVGILYFMPTVVSLLVSSDKNVRLLGVIIFISYIVTWFFFTNYILSVWCFFSAIISSMILYIVKQMRISAKSV